MAPRDRNHIRVTQGAAAEEFTPPRRNIGEVPIPSPVDRLGHAARLTSELEATIAAGEQRRGQLRVPVAGALKGVYVEIDSIPGLHLELARLDSKVADRPNLVAVQSEGVGEALRERAVVWIPEGGQSAFLRRFTQYAETAAQARPRHMALLERIDAIRLATLRSLWTDSPEDFPATDEKVWWELWLRRRDGGEWERLQAFATASALGLSTRRLTFPDRIVVLCNASRQDLARALDSLDDLAELRKPRPIANVIPDYPSVRQIELANELSHRTTPAGIGAAAAALLDTGVFQGHPLLAASLDPADCHRLDPAWRLDDEIGHGTSMAGLVLYGSIAAALVSGSPIQLSHRLESVRIFPPVPLANPPELYAALTAEAVARLEIQAPMRRRAVVLAITAPTTDHPEFAESSSVGQPTSWSAAIDALAAGLGVTGAADDLTFFRDAPDAPRRLFLVAVGNVDTFDHDHIARSDVELVQDPAQAWNAVSVGAYTELTSITDDSFAGWTPVAPAGELSPLSRSSVSFNRVWPVKPDVVLEGGNVAVSPGGGDFDIPEDLRLLTTRTMAVDPRPFTSFWATSAAAAQAGYLAAAILSDHADLWPETIRALLVHSAEWTPAMLARFPPATTRSARNVLRRRYGMGVPSLERATRSATDAVTLLVQDTIHPFLDGTMREMHVHKLPWPKSVLEQLGETLVSLRVTLSYFVEPNPGRRGWVQRYAYPSHGLRLALKHPTETILQFRQRVNARAREEEPGGNPQQTVSDGAGWVFGPDLRTIGSLHTDIWSGTAADLAARGVLAVYPVSGWWKQRPDLDRSQDGARYSLVVSINAPESGVDLWTPIAQQVSVEIEIPTDE